uniref:ketoacyl-synthetase C-terminal extension domain-containing protein n=1 Tax=Streptomyces sp. bgisy032 TaxID=3413773 RepID=UPI003D7530A8
STEARPWPVTDRPRRAGVSSFGISGTNAHVILEQAPELAGAPELAPGTPAAAGAAMPGPWLLSARSEEALRAQAARLRAHVVAHPGERLADIGLTLATAPTRFPEAAAVVAEDREGFLQGLAALAAGEQSADVLRGPAPRPDGRTAFLFTGQGSQRAGCGRELYERFPVFAAAVGE